MTDDALLLKVKAYYAARTSYDEAKQISDDLDKIRRGKEADLVDYMIEHQIKKVSLGDGTTPLLVNAVSISVKQENYEEIREWLRDTVGDDADFMVTIPHKPAILEHIKKKIEVEKFDASDFPPFLQCSTRPALRVNGWKGRE